MITVVLLAQIRELVGEAELRLPATYPDVASLRHSLSLRGPKWAVALQADTILVAVNQALVPLDHPLQAGDEVAFFPPVTGG